MASQQAWNDFEGIKSRIAVINSELAGSLRGCLEELYDLYSAITADPARLAEAVALADTNPVYNSTYLSEQAGKLIALRSWLIANGYILE
jgi:hypothetical protein